MTFLRGLCGKFFIMAKQKFYVVWEGHTPGVYTTWNEAKRQVDGYPQAKYKSFGSREEAVKAYKGSYWAVVSKSPPGGGGPKGATPPPKSLDELERIGVRIDGLAVDAACSGNPGRMEYRGVHIRTGKELFRVGPLEDGTNNIGEFLAIVHALALLQREGKPAMPVYSDSRNAQLWIKLKKCRTKLEPTGRNEPVFELIDRAEKWLSVNKVTNPIIKWETGKWGEIPADFGRK
jgi:ribonuclease HI